MSKGELFENDCYSLYITFNKLYEKFNKLIFHDGLFVQLVNDLKQYKNPLNQTLEKWQKIIANDMNFINTLCNTLYKEDKFSAIA